MEKFCVICQTKRNMVRVLGISLIEIFISLFGAAISALISFKTIPWIMNASLRRGIVTVDHHKPEKPKIAEPGGLGFLIAFIFGTLSVTFIFTLMSPDLTPPVELLAGLLSVVIAGLIGFLDDIFRIKWRHKVLLGFLPAFPLMAVQAGFSKLDIPLIGPVDFAVSITIANTLIHLNLYSLIIIPLAVNFAFNSFNMFAGFNGLEVGNGLISAIFILITLFITGSVYPMVWTIALIGSLLVLLYYNWYPAKTLIGDTGTLSIGTALIVAIILGNIDRLAIGVFFLHFINFVLFFVYIITKQTKKLADIDENGYLRPPCPWAVYWILPYFKKNITEKKNVMFLLTLHFIIVLIIFLLNLPSFL